MGRQWYRRVHGLIAFLLSRQYHFVLLMKSHLGSYPCPLNLNTFWNLGFLLGITILLQMITGILLSLHYTSDIHSAYYSVMHIIREVYYGWSLRFIHFSGASFVFLVLFIHVARAISYGSNFYNPNTWFSGIAKKKKKKKKKKVLALIPLL